MNKPKAWFRVIRPPIVFITVFGSIAGALLFTHHLDWKFWTAMFAWGVCWAGIMVHNDYTDLKSDLVNRPNKAIPSGAISPEIAHWVGMGMMLFGPVVIFGLYFRENMFLAATLGFWAFTLLVVGILYNYWGKNWGVGGHFLVAWGVAIIPFFGAAAVEPVYGALATAWLFIGVIIGEIGREIIVCSGDYYGDVKQGWQTVPVRLGRRTAMLTVPLFFLGYFLIFIPRFHYPEIFSEIYYIGAWIFIIGQYAMWLLIWKRMNSTTDEKRIWAAFEKYARTGTRLFIIFFEFVLLFEAFYDFYMF
jgi:4-hydroxybenzoate polyprenyltransferase